MNENISVFVIFVEAIIYNLHDCTFIKTNKSRKCIVLVTITFLK